MEGAPGWRVIERPKRRSWRAWYLIAPLAACAGLVLVAVVLHDYWSRGGSSAVEHAGPAPQAEPPAGSLLEPKAKPADPADDAGSADEATLSSEPPAPVAASIRVFIHHTAGPADAVSAIQLAAFLQVRGFDVAAIRPVEFQIDRPSVRYFFDRDRSDAERLVTAIDGFFAKDPDLAPARAIGLTEVAPKPSEGEVEVWLRGPDTG